MQGRRDRIARKGPEDGTDCKHRGIDVSKRWLDAALWPDEDVTLHVERTQHGLDELTRWLSAHSVRRIGLEASGGYETVVVDALQAHGFAVIRFNAYRIQVFAAAIGRLAKNDRVDAAIMAHATAVLPARPPKPRPRRLDPLVALLSCRRRLCDWIVDCTNQLESLKDKALRRYPKRRRLTGEPAQIDAKLAERIAAVETWHALAQRAAKRFRGWPRPAANSGP